MAIRNFLPWIGFFLAAVFFWVFPIHYSARLLLAHDERFQSQISRLETNSCRYRWLTILEVWTPRILAASCLVAIGIGAAVADNSLHASLDSYWRDRAATQILYLPYFAYGLAILMLIYLIFRRRLFADMKITSTHNGLRLLFIYGLAFILGFTLNPLPLAEFLGRAALVPLLLGGWIPLLTLLSFYGRKWRFPAVLSLFLTIEVLAFALGNNHQIRTITHAPEPGNEASETGTAKQPVTRQSISEALSTWKKINCKKGWDIAGSDEERQDKIYRLCPRPIIVATSGGASRAAFFTASVLAELTDASRKAGATPFEDRLFAISGVSGGSVGAAFYIAALKDRREASKKINSSPCTGKDNSRLTYLRGAPENFRECLQQMLAGDFLSPVAIGLIFHDALRFLGANKWTDGQPLFRDRAVLLEQSLERRYLQMMDDPSRKNHALPGTETSPQGLARPFLDFIPQNSSTWSPLLFLNASSVESGRRIVISPVDPKLLSDPNQPSELQRPYLFDDSYDLHELLADECETKKPATCRHFAHMGLKRVPMVNRDIQLSTAAMLSARFPLISPVGILKNLKDNPVVRIVDGGYFENNGAITAREIATVLSDEGLSPFILQITNDPELLVPSQIASEKAGQTCRETYDNLIAATSNQINKDSGLPVKPPIRDAQDRNFISGLFGPIAGLLNSRTARGTLAMSKLNRFANDSRQLWLIGRCKAQSLDDPLKDFCTELQSLMNSAWRHPSAKKRMESLFKALRANFAHVRVRPDYRAISARGNTSNKGSKCKLKELSMSWWMSKPVQTYLDDQITDENSINYYALMDTFLLLKSEE